MKYIHLIAIYVNTSTDLGHSSIALALSRLHDKNYLGGISHGPLSRYVILQVAHAPGMPGRFSPAADFKGNR